MDSKKTDFKRFCIVTWNIGNVYLILSFLGNIFEIILGINIKILFLS